MENWIRAYGYIGVVLWTCIGGEEGVLLAGFLAGEGYLSLGGVILASAIGGSLGDQIYYYLALIYGERLVRRFSRLQKAYPKAERLLQRYGPLVALMSRFMTGLRIAVSTACGIFRMKPMLYTPLNLAGGFLWASLYATLAFYFGRAVSSRIRALSGWLPWVGVGLLAALALARFCLVRWKRVKAEK